MTLFLKIQLFIVIFVLPWGPLFFKWPFTIPHPYLHPPFRPPIVLYIYNEIQIRISRTVSTPRVTLWILLTLISWIMLIFTLSVHRQQTPHDIGVVTAVSGCCRVCEAACVCYSDCHVVKLICMWKGSLIISLMQMRNACMPAHTHHWQLTTKVKKTVWAILSITHRVASPPVRDTHVLIQDLEVTRDVLIHSFR